MPGRSSDAPARRCASSARWAVPQLAGHGHAHAEPEGAHPIRPLRSGHHPARRAPRIPHSAVPVPHRGSPALRSGTRQRRAWPLQVRAKRALPPRGPTGSGSGPTPGRPWAARGWLPTASARPGRPPPWSASGRWRRESRCRGRRPARRPREAGIPSGRARGRQRSARRKAEAMRAASETGPRPRSPGCREPPCRRRRWRCRWRRVSVHAGPRLGDP
jgi:hypothetical protein